MCQNRCRKIVLHSFVIQAMNDTPGTFKCHLYDHDDQEMEEEQEHEESIII